MAPTIDLTCEKCSTQFTMNLSQYRHKRGGRFCSRACFGLSRRMTIEQKKDLKRQYDIEYRAKNREKLKSKKNEYYQKTYDPETARVARKARSAWHVEYCRRYYSDPTKKAEKKDYDRKFRSKRRFGEFWEAAYITCLIKDEIEKLGYDRQTLYMMKGVYNKPQLRKRYGSYGNRIKRTALEDVVGASGE